MLRLIVDHPEIRQMSLVFTLQKGIMSAGRTVTLKEGNIRRKESRSCRKREREISVIDEQTLRLFAPSIQLKGNIEASQNLSQDPSLQ